jgi:hypothetical protein
LLQSNKVESNLIAEADDVKEKSVRSRKFIQKSMHQLTHDVHVLEDEAALNVGN